MRDYENEKSEQLLSQLFIKIRKILDEKSINQKKIEEDIKAKKFDHIGSYSHFNKAYSIGGVKASKYYGYFKDLEKIYGVAIQRDKEDVNKWIFTENQEILSELIFKTEIGSSSSEKGDSYYVCYYWNEQKKDIDDALLTIHEDTEKATFMLDRFTYRGKIQRDAANMISLSLLATKKHEEITEENHLSIYFSQTIDNNMILATFSGVNLPNIKGAMAGTAILEKVDSFKNRNGYIHEFAYYLLYRKLLFHKPTFNTDIFPDIDKPVIGKLTTRVAFHPINGWNILRTKICGKYTGYYINTSTKKFERFQLIIDTSGKTILYVSGNAQEGIIGHSTYITDKQILICNFDYQRKWDTFRFRFLINCTVENMYEWSIGIKEGMEETASKISSSRIILKKVKEGDIFPETKSWKLGELNELGDLNKEQPKIIKRFFVGDDERELTDTAILFEALGYIKYPIFDNNNIYDDINGDYTTYSLSRKTEGNSPEYYIEVHPMEIRGQEVVIKCGNKQKEHKGKVFINNNTLIINVNTPGFVFNAVYSLLSDVNSELKFTYGVSTRVSSSTSEPTARAEVLYRIDSSSKYAQTDAREIKISKENADFIAIRKSKRGLTEFLAGRLNRLILLNRDNKPNEKIKSRKDEFRRIYFHQAVYFAMRDQIKEAKRSLHVAFHHGFGNILLETNEILPAWCTKDHKLLLEELEHFYKNDILKATVLEYWGNYLQSQTI